MWEGGTRQELQGFPEKVRWLFGRGLYKAQLSRRHVIASPMKGRLRGVVELGGQDSGNAYRLYYTLKCPGFVYVLYCHAKKARRGKSIPKHEEDLIVQRLREAAMDCQERRRGQ